MILINHASERITDIGYFVDDLRRYSMPVTILLEERKNQWNAAQQYLNTNFVKEEFELGSLSDQEIERILLALSKHNALGRLEGSSIEQQKSHFEKLAHKELLVALRELTSGTSFDNIIRDEFEKIPSSVARRAYVIVSALGRVDLSMRYETLIHILDIWPEEFAAEVLHPAEGVLIDSEVSGRSRHDIGYRLSARHPVIASVVFETAVPDDDAKFEIINLLLTNLDPGFREDKRILNELYRKKEFVAALASPEMRRTVFDRVESLLPGNAFVLQHRSILERDLDDPDMAIMYRIRR